jgi:probable HAF family extracellular repeat protein
MNRIMRLFWFSLVLFMSPLALAQSAAHAFLWTSTGGMQDLGTLPGWLDSNGNAIDRSGVVVGCDGKDSGLEAAFGWTTKSGMHLLKGLSSTYSCANAVNSGQIVGVSATEGGQQHAFLWTRQGGAQDLGTLGGPSSVATGINASGKVVGYSDTAIGVTHTFLWTQDGGMQDLSSKSCPACESRAWAINEFGVIVGQAGAHAGARDYPFIWKDGSFRNLGDLGGTFGHHGGAAMGISRLGQVVGSAATSTGNDHAFLWTESGGMQDLGTLPGGSDSAATGINSAGQVAGTSSISSTGSHAFLWTPNVGMQDLGTLGGPTSGAYGINDDGEITGVADLQ